MCAAREVRRSRASVSTESSAALRSADMPLTESPRRMLCCPVASRSSAVDSSKPEHAAAKCQARRSGDRKTHRSASFRCTCLLWSGEAVCMTAALISGCRNSTLDVSTSDTVKPNPVAGSRSNKRFRNCSFGNKVPKSPDPAKATSNNPSRVRALSSASRWPNAACSLSLVREQSVTVAQRLAENR